MELAHLIAFHLALLAAIASPGPSLLYLLRVSLGEGRRAGIVTALGLGTMAALWTGAALMGLSALFTLFPWAYMALKTFGALYLIWLAVGIWRSARTPVTRTIRRRAGTAFFSGFLVNLGNPKSVFFSAAVLVVVFPADLSATDKLIIFLNHLFAEYILQTGLALLLTTGAVTRRYLALKPVLDRITAMVLGALGLRLLLAR